MSKLKSILILTYLLFGYGIKASQSNKDETPTAPSLKSDLQQYIEKTISPAVAEQMQKDGTAIPFESELSLAASEIFSGGMNLNSTIKGDSLKTTPFLGQGLKAKDLTHSSQDLKATEPSGRDNKSEPKTEKSETVQNPNSSEPFEEVVQDKTIKNVPDDVEFAILG